MDMDVLTDWHVGHNGILCLEGVGADGCEMSDARGMAGLRKGGQRD